MSSFPFTAESPECPDWYWNVKTPERAESPAVKWNGKQHNFPVLSSAERGLVWSWLLNFVLYCIIMYFVHLQQQNAFLLQFNLSHSCFINFSRLSLIKLPSKTISWRLVTSQPERAAALELQLFQRLCRFPPVRSAIFGKKPDRPFRRILERKFSCFSSFSCCSCERECNQSSYVKVA